MGLEGVKGHTFFVFLLYGPFWHIPKLVAAAGRASRLTLGTHKVVIAANAERHLQREPEAKKTSMGYTDRRRTACPRHHLRPLTFDPPWRASGAAPKALPGWSWTPRRLGS